MWIWYFYDKNFFSNTVTNTLSLAKMSSLSRERVSSLGFQSCVVYNLKRWLKTSNVSWRYRIRLDSRNKVSIFASIKMCEDTDKDTDTEKKMKIKFSYEFCDTSHWLSRVSRWEAVLSLHCQHWLLGSTPLPLILSFNSAKKEAGIVLFLAHLSVQFFHYTSRIFLHIYLFSDLYMIAAVFATINEYNDLNQE